MPGFGPFAPYPRRFGGGAARVLALLDSMNRALGSALDVSFDSPVWAKNFAIARLLNAAWATNERLANQDKPRKLTTTLERWEKILDLPPHVGDTEIARRRRIEDIFAREGEIANRNFLQALLSRALGPVFVRLEFIGFDLAVINTPETASEGSSRWSSSLATILVLVEKPAHYTEGQFYDATSRVHEILDSLVPAWSWFDWYRAPEGVAIDVPSGPSRAGFYLDEDHNLDNHVLDE